MQLYINYIRMDKYKLINVFFHDLELDQIHKISQNVVVKYPI